MPLGRRLELQGDGDGLPAGEPIHGSVCAIQVRGRQRNRSRRSAAKFTGTTFLSVPGGWTTPQLDLSGGRFTFSTWIICATMEIPGTLRQGILGLTVCRLLAPIRPSSGWAGRSSSAWHARQRLPMDTPFLSGDVLTLDQWNHVALTLNKDEASLGPYVNGELQGIRWLPHTGTARSFDIGRSSNTAIVKSTTTTLRATRAMRLPPRTPSARPCTGRRPPWRYPQ